MKNNIKEGKIKLDMFPGYTFRVSVAENLEEYFKDLYDVDINTDVGVTVAEGGTCEITVGFGLEFLNKKDFGLKTVVHECSHLTEDFMLACGIHDDEFRAYCCEYFYSETVKLLDKWKIPYKVV